uniref:Presenilin spe-4 (inferred by orthology to a C. elegans protein) n=1 Tax=Anisakis simplex TaxID=6269 RepID=A0A0M3K5S8_ANISI
LIPTALLVIAYGSVGIVAFFVKDAPLFLHQFYVICNCSLVSVFYLRMFPTHTAWFVLFCVILWDAFAVLAPIGPLRKINEKAHEYSAQVLRFLMFTAEDPHFATEEDSNKQPQLSSLMESAFSINKNSQHPSVEDNPRRDHRPKITAQFSDNEGEESDNDSDQSDTVTEDSYTVSTQAKKLSHNLSDG